jgi:uncharacterized protein YndB with AHSA1/START domain
MKNMVTIQATVKAPIEKVWRCWNEPEHLNTWVHASDDWESKNTQNDLRIGGRLTITMAARDGSEQFDFSGTYTAVEKYKQTELDLDDGRHVRVVFEEAPNGVIISESFEAETENSEEIQRKGWQAILDNFKKYIESR